LACCTPSTGARCGSTLPDRRDSPKPSVGDGSTETDSGTSPTLRHAFGAGLHHLTVRVTDNQGERSYANATVKVTKRGAAAHKKKHKHKKKHHHKRHKKHKKKT
jgi:hypothetical protein